MPGYPPWATYKLSIHASPGHVVLAPGPKTVYYERRVARAGLTPNPSSCFIAGPDAADRLAFFESLAPGMKAVKYCESTSTDPMHADADIKQCVRDLRAQYRAFLNTLAHYALLSPDEVAALSRVRVRVSRAPE